MGSFDIFRKSQEVSACNFENKEVISVIFRLNTVKEAIIMSVRMPCKPFFKLSDGYCIHY